MSLEHVPAPQLASPAELGFGAAAFLAGAGVLAGALVVVLAGAAAAFAGLAALAVGALESAAVVAAVVATGALATEAGDDVAETGAASPAPADAGASGRAPTVLPEHPFAEHDACPGVAVPAAGTSFARTGCGVPPPQAIAVLAPNAASTAAKCSNVR